MTSDYGLDSHSREQEEMERCRGGFGDADAPEPALGSAAGPVCWLDEHSGSLVHLQHGRLDPFLTGSFHLF